MMDEISVLQVETNQVKLKRDFEVSVMNKYLMAFHSMVTIAWYIQSVTGFHNFLFRLNANMVNEHKACASGRRWTCLQSFSIWYLILIYGWWPCQVLSISNSGQSSMKLWVFSSCGAGSTGWVCSQYKAGLGGWELNVLHKGGTVSWGQRTTTALAPMSSFSFALPRMHSGRDYQGGNC